MTAYSRGSERLTGTASLRNRMPAEWGLLDDQGNSSTGRATDCNLWVAGSNPAFQPSH
jgi:hypothetical protein